MTRGRGLTRFIMDNFTIPLYSNRSMISTIDSMLPPMSRPNIPPKSPVQHIAKGYFQLAIITLKQLLYKHTKENPQCEGGALKMQDQ